MGLFGKFQTHIQTTDTHKQESLRTRYFAASSSALLTGLAKTIETNGHTVRRLDSDRGELSFAGEGWDALATVIQVEGGRTAVDFTCNRENRLGTDLYDLVERYYASLQQQFPLRAIGNQSVER